MHPRRPLLTPARGALALALLLAAARPAAAEFRGDEIEPRRFKYSDDYFINVFSYRQRLTHRWRWAEADRVPRRWFWSDTAVGYDITAGSLTNDNLFVDQGAIVRLPVTDFATGEYRFVEGEDYDARYRRNEVELLFRVLRPAGSTPLLETLGRTPVEDGLFFGGSGVLDAYKEHADIGLILGWRGEALGARLDVVRPDFFYNGKAEFDSEYSQEPLTLRGKLGGRLAGADLEWLGWVGYDLPLRLEVPVPDALTFRYRKLVGGVAARWTIAEGLRVDLDASGELSRKSRRATSVDDDTERAALMVYVAGEVDVTPAVASSSRPFDVVLLGVNVHAFDERTDDLATPGITDQRLRRGEAYAEVGYVLGLPSPHDQLGLGLRAATQNGFAALRDERPFEGKHSVGEKFLSKLGLGLEATFRDGQAYGFIQFTFRLDDQTFGGGNAQVMLTF